MKSSDLSTAEYNPYYETYIKLAANKTLHDGLQDGYTVTTAFFESIPADKWDYRYEDGKWTIKEILRHIIDTERIFAYRALRFAREDKTPLPGFDQDTYILPTETLNTSLQSLLDEYQSCRMATSIMFINFSDEMLKKIGEASNNPMSAGAAGFIIVGHEKHHCNIIRERYL